MIRLRKKNKNEKASVLAVTLVILGIGLLIAISAVLVSVRERRASIGEGSSSRAFQRAESGIEEAQESIKKVALGNPGTATVSDLDAGPSTLTCDPGSKLFTGSVSGVEIELQDNLERKIDCDDTTASLDKIFYIKAYGESGNNQRSVKSTLSCAGANISSNLIGHWKFDGNYNDVHNLSEGAVENDAMPCTDGTVADPASSDYYSSVLVETVNQEPDFETDPAGLGGRKFIEFNKSGRDCAVIKNQDSYKVDKGTVSFWVRYRDLSEPGWIFSKDANGCDITTLLGDPGSGYPPTCDPLVGGNSQCDCGHLSFMYDYKASGNMGFRFQNDGNGSWARVATDSAKFPFDNTTWENVWHLITITFDGDDYILYVDGQFNDRFDGTNLPVPDPDGTLEGLLGNDWRIWLGAVYPGNFASWSQADMDDLRIYNRALMQCDVIKLFREQGK